MTKRPETTRDYRNLALMAAAFLLLLAALGFKRHHHLNLGLPAAAVVIAGVGLAAPRLLAPIYRPWTKFGNALGYVNSRVLLTAIFFLVLTPVALLRRLFNADPLKLKWDRDADSYWEDAQGDTQRARLEHLY